MRRSPIVLTATVLGTAGVLLFKPIGTTTPTSAGSMTTSNAGADSSTSSGASASTDDSGSAAAESDDSGSAAAESDSSSSSTVEDGTYTGEPATVRFGTTQVKVTIAGGKITDVVPVQLNQNDPRSYQISEDAVPTLREEVLAEQTAAVDTISGATYTSAQYEASLQSALDQAGYAAPDGSTASTDVSSIQESGGPGRDH